MLIHLHRILDSLHLWFICKSVYHYLVTNWGFAPALRNSIWEFDIQLTFIGLSSFICQLFFLKRCIFLPPKGFDAFWFWLSSRIWVFSRKNYIVVGFILALCTTTLVLDILVTIRIITHTSVEEFGKRKNEIIVVFTTGAAGAVSETLSSWEALISNPILWNVQPIFWLLVFYVTTSSGTGPNLSRKFLNPWINPATDPDASL